MTYEKYNEFKNTLAEFRNADFDGAIVVTGPEQVGKTTFTLKIAMDILEAAGQKFYLESDADHPANIAYKGSEVDTLLMTLPEHFVFINDEAIQGLYKMSYNEGETKNLVKRLGQVGTKHGTYFFNIPRFWDLHENIREHRVRYWVHIVDRGTAIWFQPNRNIFAKDSWDRENAMKQLGKKMITDLTPAEDQIKIYSQLSCYVDWFKFPNVHPDFYKKYKEISWLHKFAPNQQPAPKPRIRDILMHQSLQKAESFIFNNMKGYDTYAKVARIVNRDPKTVKTDIEAAGNIQPERSEEDSVLDAVAGKTST